MGKNYEKFQGKKFSYIKVNQPQVLHSNFRSEQCLGQAYDLCYVDNSQK